MISTELQIKKVTWKTKDKNKIKEIYISSFPKDDRMPFWLMLFIAGRPGTDFLSFYDKDTLCGFTYMAVAENLTFILYFAVDKNNRSGGYGSHILEKIEAVHPGSKIILSIEICNEGDIEQRLKRKKFYLKNGYSETGYIINFGKEDQEILVKNGEFDPAELEMFFRKYSKGIMKHKITKKK